MALPALFVTSPDDISAEIIARKKCISARRGVAIVVGRARQRGGIDDDGLLLQAWADYGDEIDRDVKLSGLGEPTLYLEAVSDTNAKLLSPLRFTNLHAHSLRRPH